MTVVRRDCGATTDFSNIVYVEEIPKNSDDFLGEKIYVLKGDKLIMTEWGAQGIRLLAPGFGKDVFLKKDSWNDVSIKYE